MKVTVIGGGAWGSTLAELVKENNHDVTQWYRRSSLSLKDALTDSELWVCAVSMKGVREVVEKIQRLNLPQSSSSITIVSATKGLEASVHSSKPYLTRSGFGFIPMRIPPESNWQGP